MMTIKMMYSPEALSSRPSICALNAEASVRLKAG